MKDKAKRANLKGGNKAQVPIPLGAVLTPGWSRSAARAWGLLLGAFLELCALNFVLRAEVPSGWSTNLTQTLTRATGSNQPVLLYFTASWCGPCRQMAATTLKETSVRKQLDQFALVAADLDANQALAGERGVSAIPTFLALDSDGEEVLRATGYHDAERFGNWLTSALVAADLARDRKEQFRQQQRAIGEALQGSDAAERQRAVATLFDLCHDRAASRQKFAQEALKQCSAAELCPGLDHPKLATRIAVANTLRARLGDTFQFDPWAPAAERSRIVADLSARLAPPVR
jgi:thiol-disulfide isomerase/thioredoxin